MGPGVSEPSDGRVGGIGHNISVARVRERERRQRPPAGWAGVYCTLPDRPAVRGRAFMGACEPECRQPQPVGGPARSGAWRWISDRGRAGDGPGTGMRVEGVPHPGRHTHPSAAAAPAACVCVWRGQIARFKCKEHVDACVRLFLCLCVNLRMCVCVCLCVFSFDYLCSCLLL